jgi:hypothetical protein
MTRASATPWGGSQGVTVVALPLVAGLTLHGGAAAVACLAAVTLIGSALLCRAHATTTSKGG